MTSTRALIYKLTLISVLTIGLAKFKPSLILPLIIAILIIHIIKLIWVKSKQKDKHDLISAADAPQFYQKLRTTLFGEDKPVEEETWLDVILDPICRVLIFFLILTYYIINKTKSVYLNIALFVSFIYMVISWDFPCIKKLVPSYYTHGGNIYICLIILTTLIIHMYKINNK